MVHSGSTPVDGIKNALSSEAEHESNKREFRPHLISSAALGNTYATICLNQKDPSDINKAAALSLVEGEDKHFFSELPVGQGIVKLQDRWTKPVLVQFPLMAVRKGAVSDSLLKRYMKGNLRGSDVNVSEGDELERVQRVRFEDKGLDEKRVAFLEDVIDFPDDGVKVRYRRLGMSDGAGNRVKERLIDDGWLESAIVPVGRSRKVLLRLRSSARQSLGLTGNRNRPESLTHEYWKHHYARLYSQRGYDVKLEASRHGGRVDVLAVRGARRIGIEVETGKSDVVANVKNCLRSGFDSVLIVTTDKPALMKVQRALATVGILIPGRIDMVLCGDPASPSDTALPLPNASKPQFRRCRGQGRPGSPRLNAE